MGQLIIRFENRYECKDGSWRVLSWKASPQPGGLIYCSGRDVTEPKRAEKALRRSERNLAVTLDSIGDAVLATDPDGKITRVNRVAEELTGWSFAEAQGRPIGEVFQIINEYTRQPAVVPVDDVLATGEIKGLVNHTVHRPRRHRAADRRQRPPSFGIKAAALLVSSSSSAMSPRRTRRRWRCGRVKPTTAASWKVATIV